MNKANRERYGSVKETIFVVAAFGFLLFSVLGRKPLFGSIGFAMLGAFLIFNGVRILPMKQFKAHYGIMAPKIIKGSGIKFNAYFRFVLGFIMIGFAILSLSS